MTAPTSAPSDSRAAIDDSSSGSADANTIASAMRRSSGLGRAANASNNWAMLVPTVIRPMAHLVWRSKGYGSRGDAFGWLRRGADPDWREGLLLPKLDLALAHQFERRREGRGAGAAAHPGIEAGLEQPFVERGPVASAADQSRERLARVGERPDLARLEAHPGAGVLLRLTGIGGEKIVEIGFVNGAAGDLHRLRRAAGEEVASKPRTVHEELRRLTDGFEIAQALRERVGEFGGIRLRRLRGSGKQEAGLQIGEPSGHHQIVGGQLQPQLARRLDEQQVLLGESEDRNPGEIHLLPPGELQQKIKRAFEAVEIHREGRIAGGRVGVEIAPKFLRSRHESPSCRLRPVWRRPEYAARGGGSTPAGPESEEPRSPIPQAKLTASKASGRPWPSRQRRSSPWPFSCFSWGGLSEVRTMKSLNDAIESRPGVKRPRPNKRLVEGPVPRRLRSARRGGPAGRGSSAPRSAGRFRGSLSSA